MREQEAGSVIWLTGLAGTGKTTLALRLRDTIAAQCGQLPVVLDGDRLREIFPGDYGYSRDERYALAVSYALLAHELASQGHLVLCATISLFREVHRWNREHVARYLEVWLRAPMSELQSRMPERYTNWASGSTAGIGVDVDFPEAPDLVIESYGETTPEIACEKVLACFKEHRV